MKEISKETIINASQGDMLAFEQIYREASGMVYGIAFKITNNTEDAQEVTQDVFLNIHRNLKKFEFRSSFKTWIYRITVNTSINAYKKISKDRNRNVMYYDNLEPESEQAIPGNNIDQESNKILLNKLLEKLNPDQRECLILKEIEGMKYKEIADSLKININTVRTRIKRARMTLLSLNNRGGGLKS